MPLRRFAERVWTRPRSDAYYRWRYESLPMHKAWVAVRDGEIAKRVASYATSAVRADLRLDPGVRYVGL